MKTVDKALNGTATTEQQPSYEKIEIFSPEDVL